MGGREGCESNHDLFGLEPCGYIRRTSRWWRLQKQPQSVPEEAREKTAVDRKSRRDKASTVSCSFCFRGGDKKEVMNQRDKRVKNRHIKDNIIIERGLVKKTGGIEERDGRWFQEKS